MFLRRCVRFLCVLGLLSGLAACASTPHSSSSYGGALPRGVHPRIVSTGQGLQCVPYARAQSGINIYGDAHVWWAKAGGNYTRANRPAVGAVFVINGYNSSKRGHLAVVRQVIDSRTIVVDHANWLNQGEIHLSTPIKDVSRRNDWSEVRVWYTPGRTLGSRVYTAQGFIYPKNQRLAAR